MTHENAPRSKLGIPRIPFDMGGKPVSFGGVGWQFMNTLWVRVITDQGVEGWGEGFGRMPVARPRER